MPSSERAVEKMGELGATVVRIRIRSLSDLTRNVAVSNFEGKIAFNRYLANLGPAAPVRTLQEFIAHGGFHASLKSGLESDERVADGLNDPGTRPACWPRYAAASCHDGHGGQQAGRHSLSASATPCGRDRRRSARAQWRALERYWFSGDHVSRGLRSLPRPRLRLASRSASSSLGETGPNPHSSSSRTPSSRDRKSGRLR